ncbi:hypothetical protein C1645_831804 [Glomus cerebriforme]|uniref:Uncharacterized protein n=1 Tax=Glomus cerebriforme TaxID=658196 RepID=A0A397SKY1_9GLOM|nr:hypothetical protein C1645_831804 [Glomus cerebriforme]
MALKTNTSSQDSESNNFYIKIYESVHLENRKILRTSGEFQDEGAWYGKYDIKQLEPEVYGCSHLYYAEEYNTIPISSINQEVHIVHSPTKSIRPP